MTQLQLKKAHGVFKTSLSLPIMEENHTKQNCSSHRSNLLFQGNSFIEVFQGSIQCNTGHIGVINVQVVEIKYDGVPLYQWLCDGRGDTVVKGGCAKAVLAHHLFQVIK